MAGVDVFFVLSGFVMVFSSQRLMQKKSGWREFLVRRAIRIVPMYWAVTALMLAALLRVGSGVALPRSIGLWATASLLFLPAHGRAGQISPVLPVGWTLNFEAFFYVLFAVGLASRKWLFELVGVVLLAVSAGFLVRGEHFPAAMFYCDPIVLEFYAGMWVARWCLTGRKIPEAAAWMTGAVALAALLWAPAYSNAWRVLEMGLPAFVLVYAVASLEKRFEKTPAFLLLLAEASYVLYLIHEPVVTAAAHVLKRLRLQAGVASFVVEVVIAVLIAVALYWSVERPILHALRRVWEPRRPETKSVSEPVLL